MEYKLAIGVSNRHIRVQMNYNYYDKYLPSNQTFLDGKWHFL